MGIRTFDGMEPDIHPDARVDPAAVVIGDVTLEADASVWPNTVLRGDRGAIHIEAGANVQDGAVCHEGATIREGATVGHNAIVHSATVGERALVGMGATVLDGSVVGEAAMVGANALVTEGTEIDERTLVAGIPAEVVKQYDSTPWEQAGEHYVELARQYDATSELLD